MDGSRSSTRLFDLAEVPFPRVLAKLLAERFSGELTVRGEGIETHVVGFAGGLPRWCEANLVASRLGTLLVGANAVSAEELASFLARGPDVQGRKLGERLLAAKLVDKASLHEALREQCERRLVELFALQRGQAVLTPGDTVKHAAYPLGRTYLVIRLGVQKHFDDERIVAELGEVPRQLFGATRQLRRRRKEFDFSKAEAAAVDELFTPDGVSFADWVNVAPLDDEQCRCVLYVLHACGLIEELGPVTETPRRPTSEIPALASAETQGSPPTTDATEFLARDLLDGSVDDRTPFESLGLEPDAGLETIDAAGAKIQQRLERIAKQDGSTIRCEAAARLVDKLVLAARELREQRCESRGEQAIEEERWSAALPLYEDLLELRRGDVPCRVALAWIRYQLSDRDDDDARRTRDRLAFLGKSDDAPPATHRYCGLLLESLGDLAAAQRAFERAARLDSDDALSARRATELRSQHIAECANDEPPPEPTPKTTPNKDRPLLLSGRWPLIWTVAGVTLLGLLAAQVLLRMDM